MFQNDFWSMTWQRKGWFLEEKQFNFTNKKGELITDIKYISLTRKFKAIKQEDVEETLIKKILVVMKKVKWMLDSDAKNSKDFLWRITSSIFTTTTTKKAH